MAHVNALLLLALLFLLHPRHASADMDLDDLNDGSMTRILGDPKLCPAKIRFRTERQPIRASQIRVEESTDCTGSAQIPLRTITGPQPLSASAPVRFFASRFGDVERFFVGSNSAELTCGPITFADDLEWIFLKPDDELDDVRWSDVYGRTPAFASDGQEFDFDDDERYLLIGDICFYEDTDLFDDDNVCFPADATVQLEDGSVKTMDTLVIGDRVHVGNGLYSDIFAWTHQDAKKKYKFIQLTTEDGGKISATPSHYIYADGQSMQMKHVKIGMSLRLADGAATRVLKKESLIKTGLYNPQTLHGDIVVDGIIATTYTASVQPEAAHALLAPVRAAFKAIKGFLPEQATEL